MPGKRQNLMFTATFPGSIRKLVRKVMNEPEIINVDDLYDDAAIKQRVFTVNHDKKNDLLAHLLKENDWQQVLVFCSAKRSCLPRVSGLTPRRPGDKLRRSKPEIHCAPFVYRLGHQVLILERGVRLP